MSRWSSIPSLVLFPSLVGIMFSGCATDPFTTTMESYGFTPIVPSSETVHVGDVYRTTDLMHPFVLMRDLFPAEDNAEMMKSMEDNVSIPVVTEGSRYTIGANVDVIGKASLELADYNARKFSVKCSGVTQYVVSETRFNGEILPSIQRQMLEKFKSDDYKSDDQLIGKYVVVALLRVADLEYELYDEREGKVAVQSGSDLEALVKARLGPEWSANRSENLSISSPRFIGYRMGRITENGMSTPLTIDLEMVEIPPSQLREGSP